MRFFIASFFLLVVHVLSAQTDGSVIHLRNPSFEGLPSQGKPPVSWDNCGHVGETPPDIQPSDGSNPFFRVNKPAFDGKTYLGMVTRDNDTYEAVSQRLSSPLQADKCYEFSIHLARSNTYESLSRVEERNVFYNIPIKLRIWGSKTQCGRQSEDDLLAESGLVINTRWLVSSFHMEPKKEYDYIILEAFYNTPTPFPYNGNILVDNASPIIMVPCEEELAIAEASVPQQDKYVNQSPQKTTPTKPASQPAATPNQPKQKQIVGVITPDLRRDNLKLGKTLTIKEVFFDADSTKFSTNSISALNELYQFLKNNQDLRIEVGGHTNSLPPSEYCDRLSLARAKSVAQYLNEQGISWDRLRYKGYGKKNPIATNDTEEGRRENQRVEIKILGMRAQG